ncbi:MAG: hypothetical protein ACR65W_20600 [Methylocystis sp.]|uniref:hypothetical protein n=1 Tax=Methylocystis sp. TaxID=1911079 RepID=UPI003DA3DA17
MVGPGKGFRVEVHVLEARKGGALEYDMIADAPEAIAAMKGMGAILPHPISRRALAQPGGPPRGSGRPRPQAAPSNRRSIRLDALYARHPETLRVSSHGEVDDVAKRSVDTRKSH